MSDVEKFWEALRPKWTDTPQKPWNELSPQKQHMIMQALQIMIQAMHIQ